MLVERKCTDEKSGRGKIAGARHANILRLNLTGLTGLNYGSHAEVENFRSQASGGFSGWAWHQHDRLSVYRLVGNSTHC